MTLPLLTQAQQDAGRFATSDSATWLSQADAAALARFDELCAARDYQVAYEALGLHLVRTETNRVRVHGPAPDPAQVWAGYLAQLDAQWAGAAL